MCKPKPLIKAFVGLLLWAAGVGLVHAGSLPGAFFSWRFLDSTKLICELNLIRDCRGIQFQNQQQITINFRGQGRSVSFNKVLTRNQIKDITPMCAQVPGSCDGMSFGGDGYERHAYSDTIDLEYQGIRSGEEIVLEYGQCCRTGSITTGSKSQNVYTYATIKARSGQSATPRNFMFLPGNTVFYNPDVYPKHDDSISYEWVRPMRGPNQFISYITPNGLPVKPYFSITRSYPYTDPNNYPPQGFYFNENTGDMVFEVADAVTLTPIVYVIKQWQKSGDTYQLKSEYLFEQLLAAYPIANEVPELNKEPLYGLTSGIDVELILETNDQPLRGNNDSVMISWRERLAGATYRVDDSAFSRRNPALVITWTPPQVNEVTRFYPIITLSDNNCPTRSVQHHTLTIEVRNQPKARRVYSQLSCGKLALESLPDSANMGQVELSWRVLNMNGLPLNTEVYDFMSKADSLSPLSNDTIQFYQAGSFVIEHQVWYPKFDFRRVNLDTIHITETFPDIVSWGDSFTCIGSDFELKGMIPSYNDSIAWFLNDRFEDKGIVDLKVEAGRYRIRAQFIDSSGCLRQDYLSLSVLDVPNANLGEDVFPCSPYEYQFQVEAAPDYPWASHLVKWNGTLGNDTNSTTVPGLFVVEVENRCGIAIDSLWVIDQSFNLPPIPENAFCEGDTLLLGSPFNGIPWQWLNADSGQAIHVARSGQYTLSLFSTCNELKRLNQRVLRHTEPRFLLPKETAICDGEPISLSAGNFDLYTVLLWNDNKTEGFRSFDAPGEYVLTASNVCGIFRDTVQIVEQESPRLLLPKDTFFCINQELRLLAGNQDGVYQWNDGVKTSERVITKAGKYRVQIYNYCGSAEAEVQVKELDFIPPDLGRDTILQENASLILRAGAEGNDHHYQWNTGDTTNELKVNLPGTYIVRKWNACGSATDTIVVSFFSNIELTNRNQLIIYPNPTSGKVQIKGVPSGVVTVKIIDVQGRYHEPLSVENRGKTLSVNTGDIPAGTYQLEISSENGKRWYASFLKE